MKIMYRTTYFNDSIEQVEVVKETEKQVVIKTHGDKTRRSAKMARHESYFNTWGDAHAYLLDKAQSSVLRAAINLELARAKLGNIKGMEPVV